MEQMTTGNIHMTWDPEKRLACIGFEAATQGTGRDAEVMVEAMTRWVGTEGTPFGLLGDGEKLSGVDAEFRSVWGSFFRQHREESSIAFYNQSSIVRIASEMFRIGTGIHLKAVAREADARAWLRGRGIPA